LPHPPKSAAAFSCRPWFYLGLAGLIGATGLAGYDRALVRGWTRAQASWQTFALIALVVTLQCVAYGIAESIG